MSATSGVPKLAMEKYQDNYLRIYGSETKTYKDMLKAFGCSWNPHLKGGAGWILKSSEVDSVRKIEELVDSVNSGGETGPPVPQIKVGYVVEYGDMLEKIINANSESIETTSSKLFSSKSGEWVMDGLSGIKIAKIYVPK